MPDSSKESSDFTDTGEKNLLEIKALGEDRAIGIPEARRILGEDAEDLSDEEVERMINLFYLVASVAYDDYNSGANNSDH